MTFVRISRDKSALVQVIKLILIVTTPSGSDDINSDFLQTVRQSCRCLHDSLVYELAREGRPAKQRRFDEMSLRTHSFT
jgi:hypothetical protein